MILMLQIFDVIANENAHYKCNELELPFWQNYYDIIHLQEHDVNN